MDVFVSIIPFESAVQLPRFHTKAGEEFIDLGRIVYLKAQLNYTVFYLLDGEQVVTSLSLSTYARLLEPYGFVRVHKSCLLNGQYLSRCEVIQDQLLILPDRQQVTIARRRRKHLWLKIEDYTGADTLKKAVKPVDDIVAQVKTK